MTLADARAKAISLRGAMDEGIQPRPRKARRRPARTSKTVSAAATSEHSVDFLVSEFMERHVKPRRKRPE